MTECSMPCSLVPTATLEAKNYSDTAIDKVNYYILIKKNPIPIHNGNLTW